MHLLTTEIKPRALSELSVSRSQNAIAPPQPVATINRSEGCPVVWSLKELHLRPGSGKARLGRSG
jgi:hypothetical protein